MKKIFSLLSIVIIIISCQEDPPVYVDGTSVLSITAVWNTASNEEEANYSPLSNAKVLLISNYGERLEHTDNEGKLELNNLLAAEYNISVTGNHPNYENLLLIGGKGNVLVSPQNSVSDTILTKIVSSSGIAINEVYSVGPVNNIFYFYDLFVELYNSSMETKYLDGMMICRLTGNGDGKGPGADEDYDDDIDGVTMAFKFPGNPGEKNYPFESNTFIYIAAKAIDHREFVEGSVDLSHADWEFYNQFSSVDYDNPDVPNLTNLNSEKTSEFLLGITNDIVVLASGEDENFEDGIDIDTVIDAVEYQRTSSSKVTLDNRLDRSWAKAPPKYSGQSMQRREPGMDTNDSSIDWEVISAPTPGFHKN